MGYGISCKLSPEKTICMKCQILFSEKNIRKKKKKKKKTVINFSPADLAQRVIAVNEAI